MSHQCCLGYGPAYPDCKRKYMFLSNNLLIIAINIKAMCNDSFCGTNMECSVQNTCVCTPGWTGSDCLTGIYFSLYKKSS